jgi:hypothetical protein
METEIPWTQVKELLLSGCIILAKSKHRSYSYIYRYNKMTNRIEFRQTNSDCWEDSSLNNSDNGMISMIWTLEDGPISAINESFV